MSAFSTSLKSETPSDQVLDEFLDSFCIWWKWLLSQYSRQKSEMDSEAIIGDVPVMVSIVNQIWRLDLQHI